jgi:hypothetical protein
MGLTWISKAVSDYGCEFIEADSHELFKPGIGVKLDLIFVDGDHGELGVHLDAGFADFLPVGGMILFQDCYDWDKPGDTWGVPWSKRSGRQNGLPRT